MTLTVISSPAEIAGEAQEVNELFAAGLVSFHLRKPAAPSSYLEKLLLHIQPAYYPRIVLPCHQQGLADAFGITRLHFPEQTRKELSARAWQKYREKGYRLSTSVHDTATLQGLPPVFEYTFFGPVFSSISKPGYRSVLPEGFQLPQSREQVPAVALGGVDKHTIKQVKEMNFAGAAVLGAIWCQPKKALDQFITLKERCRPCAPTC